MTDILQQIGFSSGTAGFSLSVEDLAEAIARMNGGQLTAEQRRYLRGPIVAADQGWAQTTSGWLLRAIPKARFERVAREAMGRAEGEKATLEEVAVYLYTASLAGPLNHDAALVDFWVMAQVLAKYTAETPDSVWDKLGLGEEDRDLSDLLRREVLERLRYDIRRAVSRRR